MKIPFYTCLSPRTLISCLSACGFALLLASPSMAQVEAPEKPDAKPAAKPAATTSADEGSPMARARATITAKLLEGHGTTLASDAFEGRLTGTAGQQKAAEYFRTHFEKFGLQPWGDSKQGKRGWEQLYEVQHSGLVADKTGIFGPDGKKLCEH
ncbi:MAG TPA: hypothetical protein PKE00_04255, partial [Planctomycetota bacterium]|nr:hypothetical protein [Planctomycetota bacterium]